jgi:hypothetical protein
MSRIFQNLNGATLGGVQTLHLLCRWSVDADFQALIRDGRGDVSVVNMKWR